MSTNESTDTMQPAVAALPDPALVKEDMHANTRRARLRELEAKLNAESQSEMAQRTIDRIDGKAPEDRAERGDTEGETADESAAATPKKPDKGWQRVEERTRREAGLIDDKGNETAAAADGDATDDEQADEAEEKPEPAAAKAEDTAVDEQREKLSKLEKERKERFEKTLKLQAKLRERDERVRAMEDRLAHKEQELADREQHIQQRLSKSQERVALAEKVIDLATNNPLELLERAGVPPERVAQWIREAGDPVKQETRGIQKEIADLRAQLARERQEQDTERRRIQAQRDQQRVESEFLSFFDTDKDAFEPARIAYSKRERIALANEIAEKATKRGIRFTLRDIAEAVNETAKDAENYKEYVALKGKATKTDEKPAAAVTTATKPVARQAPAVAVHNAVTQQRSDAPHKAPRDWKEARKQRLARRFAELDANSPKND